MRHVSHTTTDDGLITRLFAREAGSQGTANMPSMSDYRVAYTDRITECINLRLALCLYYRERERDEG